MGKALAHGYRNLQHWNQWLAQAFLGQRLLAAEQALISPLLSNHFGKHALLIGVPHQQTLLNASVIPCHSSVSPILHHGNQTCHIESDFHDLPIQSGSIDLVILPHTLEFIEHPRQLLAEACRVIKPEGLMVITGFNPYSLWGMKKVFMRHQGAPWSGNFIPIKKIKKWLKLADFKLEQQQPMLFRPPINHPGVFDKLQFMETIGSKCLPMAGSAYILLARAKVIPLTPIKLKWKQQLSGIRISPMSGYIAR
jgi:SAM-dependent methyltransferase